MAPACWTCRLRQISCDGKPLRCRTCEACGLVCEGYGPKQPWMDGGSIQREYVERLNRIATYNTQQKSKEQHRTSSDLDGEDQDDGDNADEQDGEDALTARGHDDEGNNDRDETVEDGSSHKGVKSDQATPPTPFCEEESPPGPALDSASILEQLDTWIQVNAVPLDPSPPRIYNGLAGLTSLDQDATMPAPRASCGCCTCLEMSCKICLRNLTPLLHFIDRSPFYGDDRAWIHVYVIRSELIRCSSLALACYWSPKLFGVEAYETRQGASSEASAYHSMILAMLQDRITNVGSMNLAVSRGDPLEILVSTINMILFQVSRVVVSDPWGRHILIVRSQMLEAHGDHWQIHLRAGIDLLRMRLCDQLSMTLGPANAASSLTSTVERYVVDTFVWLDTLSSTLFWNDNVQWDHAGMIAQFQAGGTRRIPLLGCRSWVIVAVSQANQIRRWKDLMTSQGSLSNIVLVKRASQLQDYIAAQLQNLHASDISDETTVGTYLYAQAASIYVHVLVSGPYPDIPEIRHTVEDCLSQIEKAETMSTSPRFAWPLCIIGCMAPRELQNSFQTAMEKLGRRRNPTHGYDRALVTMRECWRLRENKPSQPVHWASAMGTLGNLFLIL